MKPYLGWPWFSLSLPAQMQRLYGLATTVNKELGEYGVQFAVGIGISRVRSSGRPKSHLVSHNCQTLIMFGFLVWTWRRERNFKKTSSLALCQVLSQGR